MITEIKKIEHYGFKHLTVKSNLSLEKQKEKVHIIPTNVLFFHIYGDMEISWENHKNITIKSGELYLLPKGAHISACITSDYIEYVSIQLIHDIENKPIFMDILNNEMQRRDISTEPSFPQIPFNEVMSDYVKSVKRYTLDKIKSTHLFNAKLLELYVIFNNYYSKLECINLFGPILHSNLKFRMLVLENYKINTTINELVEAAHMSRSTFDRNFKTAFGTTPLKWIELQIRKLIITKASEPNVTVKDIMCEVGIHNPSQFTQLCKRICGESPSQLLQQYKS